MKKYLKKLEKIQSFYYQYHKDLSLSLESNIYTTNSAEFIKEINTINAEYNDEERPLHIAVVGNFSTGKSTFINSLLEDELLGMKIEPATAKITKLLYDKDFKIQKILNNGKSEDISLQEYQSLSVHENNQKNRNNELENISYFKIYYNKSILNKINISDTPGFSSMSNKDDKLTKEWIKKVDLLVWLIDINKGITKNETDNLKLLSDAHTVFIINKADEKSPPKRKKIQQNISDNFEQDNFLYSAKPVLDYKINLRKNKEQFNELLKQADNFFEKGENFDIKFSDNEVKIINSKNDIKIERILLEEQDEIQTYINYNKEVYLKFDEIKNNIAVIKRRSLEKKIRLLYDAETEKINLIKNKLEKRKQENTNKYEILKKKLEEQYSHIKKKSEKDFDNFRINLFNQIFEILFNHKYGGVLIHKHKFTINEIEKDIEKIKEIIDNSFTNFYQLILKDAKKLLKSIQIEFDDTNYEIMLIDFIKDTYIEASIDSLKVIYNLWNDIEIKSQNIEKTEKYIKKQIDLAIADERMYHITLEFLKEIYQDTTKNTQNETEEKNNIINQLLENMNITADYQQQKQSLLSTFDLLKEYKFIPCKVGNEQINEEEIKQHKENLINETFTISVCGQINAGKSTLLNYMLFKDEEILPSDDTPWTAKLTTIKYGQKSSANVTFYNEKEWNDLKNLIIKDDETNQEITYFEKYLKEEVENSAENGIFDKEIIKQNALTKEVADLTKLREYVAKGGIYTPFVAHVELITNNDLLKNVIIVDTPGINDPNIQRSEVTEEWINKSNAVVYLFYAGAALDIADFDFIDKYLQFIPSEKIIFAINKADTNGEYKRAKTYVENSLRTNIDLKERNLLKNREVYPISSLAALLNYKKENNIELNEDEQWHYKRLKNKANDFIENEGYVADLTEAIKTNIMQSKGNDILNKAKQTIETICKSKITDTEKNIAENQSIINNIDHSIDELKSKITEIDNIRININDIIRKYNEIITNKSKKYQSAVTESTDEIKTTINEGYEKWLKNKKTTIDKAIKLTGYKLKGLISSELNKINNLIPKEIETDITILQDEYKREVKAILNEDLKNLIDYFLVPTIELRKILNSVDKYLDELNLTDLKESVWGFLRTKEEESKDAFFQVVSERIEKFIRNVNNNINQTIENSVTEFLDDTKKGIDNNLNSYEKELGNLQNMSKDKNTNKKEKIELIENLQKELSNLELNYKTIKQKI